MLKIEHTEVCGWETAIRGMRNPLNSWDKSDSAFNVTTYWDKECMLEHEANQVILGDNDLALMKKLVKAGSDHRKFLRQIIVSLDIIAPLYWWKEYDTYKVGTVANSCSTMHTIHKKEFELDDFSHEHLTPSNKRRLEDLIITLNYEREDFLEDKDKLSWWQMIQLLPTSYNQRRTVTLNYEVLRNIYYARKNHKLDEWHTLCEWIEGLPYFREVVLDD